MTQIFYGKCYVGSTETQLYKVWLEVTVGSFDVASNTTPLTVSLKLQRNPAYADDNSAYNLEGKMPVSLKIDGETVYSTTTAKADTRWGQIWTFVTKTANVQHASSGEKSVTIEGAFSGMAGSLNSGSVKVENLALPTIPRASSLDAVSSSTAYFTGDMNIQYTPKSANYYNRAEVRLNQNGVYTAVKTLTLGKKVAAQQIQAVTLSASELATVYNKITGGTKGVLQFTLKTYSDSGYSALIGEAEPKELTLNIPEDATTKPTLTMSLAPVHTLPAAFDGLYIQGKSEVRATLTASGQYGATIQTKSISLGGNTYGAAEDYTSKVLSDIGANKVTGYVKDSRGFTGSAEENITVIGYTKPQIKPVSGENSVVAARCDAAGNLSDTGTYLVIKAVRSYSKVMASGVQKNFCRIRYRYKLSGGASFSDWAEILASNAASDQVVTGPLLNGGLDVAHSYVVEVQAVDDVGENATASVTVPTDKVYMHRDKGRNAMSLGKMIEEDDALDVAWNIIARSGLRFPNEIAAGALLSENDIFCRRGGLPDGTDLDTLFLPGVYGLRENGNYNGAPLTNGFLIVFSLNDNTCLQIFVRYDAAVRKMRSIWFGMTIWDWVDF